MTYVVIPEDVSPHSQCPLFCSVHSSKSVATTGPWVFAGPLSSVVDGSSVKISSVVDGPSVIISSVVEGLVVDGEPPF